MTNPSPNDTETTREFREEFRPCHGCGRHFMFCVCNRREAKVLYELRCPNCDQSFRIAPPKHQRWVQRCGHCLKAFDAVVGGAE